MKSTLLIAGVLMLIVGLVWMGQGANLIGGSFMTGQSLWLKIGVVFVLIGTGLIWWARFGRSRP